MALAITTTTVSLSATGNNFEPLVASGATGPVVWSLAAGSQCPGRLRLSSDGRLLGTPGVTGTFTVTVAALDTGTVPSTSSGIGPGNTQSVPAGPPVAAQITLHIS